MRFTWFNLMPWPYLPDDFRQQNRSVWVDIPGKLFAAGFRDPAQPDEVAETILAAITSAEYRLRWPVGKDAIGLSKGRPRISDETWVAMGDDLPDQDYNQRFFEYFGVRL